MSYETIKLLVAFVVFELNLFCQASASSQMLNLTVTVFDFVIEFSSSETLVKSFEYVVIAVELQLTDCDVQTLLLLYLSLICRCQNVVSN